MIRRWLVPDAALTGWRTTERITLGSWYLRWLLDDYGRKVYAALSGPPLLGRRV